MNIFISYRRADNKPVVERIRDRLVAKYGENAIFRDIQSIPPGANYVDVLKDATSSCNVMLVVIGPQWVSMTDQQGRQRLTVEDDWTRIEVERGLANQDATLLIPVLICDAKMPGKNEIPESIGDLVFRNAISIESDPYFDTSMELLIEGIDQAPFQPERFEPETILIPHGPFWMGSDPGAGIPDYETPRNNVVVPAFRMGKYPVTNEQYEVFVRETNHPIIPEMLWDGLTPAPGTEKQPVIAVNWYDAMAYCNWLKESTKRDYALPNEAQWEKACRGRSGGLYPWGDEFQTSRSNHGNEDIAAVDAFPAQSDYGCHDFVGNIRQWTLTLWGESPRSPDQRLASYPIDDPRRNDVTATSQIRRVVRGSTFRDDSKSLRCSLRSGQMPKGLVDGYRGFRVVINSKGNKR